MSESKHTELHQLPWGTLTSMCVGVQRREEVCTPHGQPQAFVGGGLGETLTKSPDSEKASVTLDVLLSL